MLDLSYEMLGGQISYLYFAIFLEICKRLLTKPGINSQCPDAEACHRQRAMIIF